MPPARVHVCKRWQESEAAAMMKTQATRLHLAALLILCSALLAAAQERPLPPARMILPSDSLAARRTPAKLEADSSRIELPDVVVFGQDRSVRQVESKRRSGDEGPRLLRPDYSSLSIFARRDNSRPLVNAAAAARDRLIWANAAAGSYTSVIADAGYSGKFTWGSARFSGWLDRSNGAFNNSRHAGGGVAATATTPLRPELHGRAQAEMSWLSRGLHGAVLPDLSRKANHSLLAGEVDFAIDPLSSARAGLQIAGAGISTDSSSRELLQSGEFVIGLHGSYQRQMERFTLRAHAAYTRESLSADPDSLDDTAGFSQIRAEVQTSLLRNLQLTAALGYQDFIRGRFAPSLRLAFIPNDRWGITAAAWAGLRHVSIRERLLENPYLSHGVPLAADDSPLSLQVQSDFRPVGSMVFHFGLFHGRYDQLNYWQRDDESGLIGLYQVEKIRLTELQAGVRVGLHAGMMLQGELHLNSDHLEEAVGQGDDDRVPYRPDYRARASLGMPLPWQLQLNAQLEMVGERRRGLDMEGRLPEYVLLNAGVGRKFGRHLYGELAALNILDRRYVIWEGYDEPGIQFMAKARWSY